MPDHKNSYTQINKAGSVGTQGQTGDNFQHNYGSDAADAIAGLQSELEKLSVGVDFAQDGMADDVGYANPHDLLVAAVTEAKSEINEGRQDRGFSDLWLGRLEKVSPIVWNLLSDVALQVLNTYAPVSPILKAIAKLVEVVKQEFNDLDDTQISPTESYK